MKTYRTAAEIHKEVKGRHNAAVLLSTLQLEAKHQREMEAKADGNPYDLLTTAELQELARLEAVEAAQKEAARQSVIVSAQFLLANPHVPASLEAGKALGDYLDTRGLPRTQESLGQAFDALVSAGVLTPNYSQANREVHHRSIEGARAMGLDIKAPLTEEQLRSMPLADLQILDRQAQEAAKRFQAHAGIPTADQLLTEQLTDEELLRRAGGFQYGYR